MLGAIVAAQLYDIAVPINVLAAADHALILDGARFQSPPKMALALSTGQPAMTEPAMTEPAISESAAL